MANLKDNHEIEKSLSVKTLFKGIECSAKSIQLLKGGMLPEHITQTDALLLCVNGIVTYEDERGMHATLFSGDYYNILPMIKHWIKGVENSQLVLLK